MRLKACVEADLFSLLLLFTLVLCTVLKNSSVTDWSGWRWGGRCLSGLCSILGIRKRAGPDRVVNEVSASAGEVLGRR